MSVHTIRELSRETGYTAGYIRLLVCRGVLPRPEGGRRHALYPEEALRRLLYLRKRRDRVETNADLAERWGGVEDDEDERAEGDAADGGDRPPWGWP